jgi:hypothetical protein
MGVGFPYALPLVGSVWHGKEVQDTLLLAFESLKMNYSGILLLSSRKKKSTIFMRARQFLVFPF